MYDITKIIICQGEIEKAQGRIMKFVADATCAPRSEYGKMALPCSVQDHLS